MKRVLLILRIAAAFGFVAAAFYSFVWPGQLTVPAHPPRSSQRDARPGSSDLFPFRNASGLYGYQRGSGQIVIRGMYQDAQPFAEGLAAVKAVERWGYITTEGRTAIGYFYQVAAMFSNGVARVIRNGKAYEIDQGGNIVRRLIRRP